MTRTKATLRFWLRTDRVNADGTAPVHFVYQIKGARRYYAVPGVKLLPVNWDSINQRAVYLDKSKMKGVPAHRVPTARDIQAVNDALEGVRAKVRTIEHDFNQRGQAVNTSMVIEKLKDGSKISVKDERAAKYVFDFIDKYIADHTATRNAGSLTVYRSLKNHLAEYQKAKRVEVAFEGIDYAFFQAFQNFLIQSRGLNNTTTAKQLSTLKTFLNYARKHGVQVNDGHKDFRVKREALEVIALTNDEFEALFNLPLPLGSTLDRVRDVFCFSCSSGLRYSDLRQLKREHIKGQEIRIVVTKTKEPLTIPLNRYSSEILAKYAGNPAPLPMMSNQKLNIYLKDLCKRSGIDEDIEIVRFRGVKREAAVYPKYELVSVHTGRKTFATLSLEKGMSAEEVMSITGHRDYKSFSRYIKVTEQRKSTVMRKAWGAANDLNLKAV